MVLGPKLEGNGVTLSSLEAVRLEDKTSRLVANNNDVVCGHRRAYKGGSSED
jgi:hypothetical protein